MHTIVGSVDELLRDVERREPFTNPDGRSSSRFERVWIGGAPHIVKYVHPDLDFTMRVTDDRNHRTARAWAAGLLDSAPHLIDHGVVAIATGWGRDGSGSALLMRDLTAELLPLDGTRFDVDRHTAFLDHIAGFCAATWGWADVAPTGSALLDYGARFAMFGAGAVESERALGWPERVPQIAAEGWERFGERAPQGVCETVLDLHRDCTPLVAALRRTPSCFLHGDVKASNTGVAADGRTVLIDWAYVGEGPACHELAWHLALDRDLLAITKEESAAAFRAALERHGVDTAPWWQAQLDLCLLGALVEFGWEKALGDDEELGWWCSAARAGIDRL